MYIQERIVSRKVLVISIYEQIIQTTPYNDSFVFIQREIDKQRYHFSIFHNTDECIDHMAYMAERFFSLDKKQTLDISYLKEIIQGREENIDNIITIIDMHCSTFNFEKMDPMDKAIFLAGSLEYLIHKTEKKVLLNEMIEIAKRYGDEGSAKLINGIGHKIIDSI